MTFTSDASRFFLLLLILCLTLSCASQPPRPLAEKKISLIQVTPDVTEYAYSTVKPVIASHPEKDRLSLLLKVSEILNDPVTGIGKNKIAPDDFMIYDMLSKIKLDFLVTVKLSPEQKQILELWHSRYMGENPADVFFAPPAGEIIRTKAAFGCSHYARAFIAVVKALNIINEPEDMRYAISSKSDDYNQALEKSDKEMTINGHQFVIVRIDSRWIAINTSKSEYTVMPENFSPDDIQPPENIPVRFGAYPDVTFLLRKISRNFNEDCNDNSLSALMNISRSGDSQSSDFRWEKFIMSGDADAL
jgi:hypothetical protein